MSGFSALPCSGPMLGTCISSGFCISALLLPAIGLAQSRWVLPCGTESQSHCTVIRKDQKEVFLDHLNSIHNSIQFTSEDPSEDCSIPFLDMLVFPDEEGRLKTTVYRKPTHTNQYLYWDSHHAIPSKYSMIGTLFHRAKTICSGPTQLQEEEEHLYRTLKKCKYPNMGPEQGKAEKPDTSPQEE